MIDTCILYPEQYNLIWRVSFLALFSSIYALRNKQYDLMFVPGGIFITSIIYWYKPDYSWRRTLDMTFVKLALCYQIIRGYKSRYFKFYSMLLCCSIFSYMLGIYFYKKGMLWKSTYSHCMLHILANSATIILYKGLVKKEDTLLIH